MKAYLKQHQWLYYLILAIVYFSLLGVFFRPYSINLVKGMLSHNLSFEELFLYDHDWIQQGIPYYREFFRCVDERNLMWSWNEFLGNSFYASKAVYIIGDPFAWLAYLLYKTAFHYLPVTLFVITGFKLLIAGLGFAGLLKHYNDRGIVCGALGACYMVGGWAGIFLEQIYFISFYALIPFVLIGIERIMEKKGYFVFWIFILLSLITNLCLTWSLCFFLLLYWFVRNGVKEIKGKELWKSTGCVFVTFLLAFLTDMAILLPGIKVLLSSPRLSEHLIDYTFWSKENICALHMNLFIPVIDAENLLYHDYWYYFYQIGIYCGSFALLCVPQLFVQKRKEQEVIWYGVFLIVIILLFISPKVGILLNFSYSLRYSYFAEIMLLVLAAEALNKPFHTKTLLITAAVLIGIIGILVFGTSGLSPEELRTYPECWMLGGASLAILLHATLLSGGEYTSYQQVASLILAVFEVLAMSSITIQTKTTQRTPAEYLVQEEGIQEVYTKLREYDDTFYRVNLLDGVNVEISELPNSPMYYGIPALSGYGSVYNYAIHDFLSWLELYPDVSWNFRINDARLDEVLAVKYTIATPATAPLVNEYAVLMEELSSNEYLVYKMWGDNRFAQSATGFMRESEITALMCDFEGNRNLIVDYLRDETILPDELYDQWIEPYQNTATVSFDGVMEGKDILVSTTLDKESPIQFSVPADAGWTLYVDENEHQWETADGGFIIALIPEGTHAIRLSYQIPGFRLGLILSVFAFVCSMIWFMILRRV